MPIAVEYDPSTRVITYRVTGDPSIGEMTATADERRTHPDRALGLHVVWDLRAADLRALDSGMLRQSVAEAAKRLEDESPDQRIAVIASRDLEFGMARVFEAYAGGPPSRIRVFRTDEGVMPWLLGGVARDAGPPGSGS